MCRYPEKRTLTLLKQLARAADFNGEFAVKDVKNILTKSKALPNTIPQVKIYSFYNLRYLDKVYSKGRGVYRISERSYQLFGW